MARSSSRHAGRAASLTAPRRGTTLIGPEAQDGPCQGPEEPQARPRPPGAHVSRGADTEMQQPRKGKFLPSQSIIRKMMLCCSSSYRDIAAGSWLVPLGALQTPAPKKSPTIFVGWKRLATPNPALPHSCPAALHCPGQPGPMPNHSFSKEISPNIQSEPPLMHLEAIASRFPHPARFGGGRSGALRTPGEGGDVPGGVWHTG